MIIGANQVSVNDQTLKEALAFWLNNKILGPGMPEVKVTGFDADNHTYWAITFEPVKK